MNSSTYRIVATTVASLALVAGASFAQTSSGSTAPLVPSQNTTQQPNSTGMTGNTTNSATIPNTGTSASGNANTPGTSGMSNSNANNTATNMASTDRVARADRN